MPQGPLEREPVENICSADELKSEKDCCVDSYQSCPTLQKKQTACTQLNCALLGPNHALFSTILKHMLNLSLLKGFRFPNHLGL